MFFEHIFIKSPAVGVRFSKLPRWYCIIAEYIFDGYGSTVTHAIYVASLGLCAESMLLQIVVRGVVGHPTSMALHFILTLIFGSTCSMMVLLIALLSSMLQGVVSRPWSGICYPGRQECFVQWVPEFSGLPRVFPHVQDRFVGG